MYGRTIGRHFSHIANTEVFDSINTTDLKVLKDLKRKYVLSEDDAYNDKETTRAFGAALYEKGIQQDPNLQTMRSLEYDLIVSAKNLIEEKIKLEKKYKEIQERYGNDTTAIVRHKTDLLIDNSRREEQLNDMISKPAHEMIFYLPNLSQKGVESILKDQAYGMLILPHISEIKKTIISSTFDGIAASDTEDVGVKSLTKLFQDALQDGHDTQEISYILNRKGLALLGKGVARELSQNLEDTEVTGIVKERLKEFLVKKLDPNKTQEHTVCPIF